MLWCRKHSCGTAEKGELTSTILAYEYLLYIFIYDFCQLQWGPWW
jgi:hypothetical protein